MVSESILQRKLDEAKASVTVTYWHLFQTTETLLKEITRLSNRNTQLMEENERQRALLAALKREPATPRTTSGGEASRGFPGEVRSLHHRLGAQGGHQRSTERLPGRDPSMNAIQNLRAALDDYDDDELMRIIEDADLDDVRYLRDLAQEAVDIAEEYEYHLERVEER